jgi:electron transfer flavoprotein alpha/beta subunit
MNIIVCVKPVPDVSIVSLDPHLEGQLDKDDFAYIVNPCDMVAVEEAVRIKEGDPASQVILLSMTPPSNERLLHRCLAIGADEAMFIWDSDFHEADSYATGAILAEAIRSLQYDLVFCGNKADDTNAGQVDYVIAHRLDIPVVSRVTNIQVSRGDNKLSIERKLERGNRERVEVELPSLLAVEESLNEPRYASLPSLLTALRKDIKQYTMKELEVSAEEIGLKKPKTKQIAISAPRPRPKKLFTPDSSLSAAERMRLIMSGGVTEKKEDLLEGSPVELSSKFIQFLKQLK